MWSYYCEFRYFFFLFSGCELGLTDYTPPYLAPTTVGHVVLKGVNYASGGAGILNETGKIFVRFGLSKMWFS